MITAKCRKDWDYMALAIQQEELKNPEFANKRRIE